MGVDECDHWITSPQINKVLNNYHEIPNINCRVAYCYNSVIVTIRLLLQFGYCYNSVIVTIRLLLQFGYCYSSVIVTVRLLL